MAEVSGIFNWMLEGFRQWRVGGLAPPDAVLGATEDYRADMDHVGNFLKECYRFGPEVKGFTKASLVHRCYQGWMKDNGMRSVAAPKFHARMERDHKLFRVRRTWTCIRISSWWPGST